MEAEVEENRASWKVTPPYVAADTADDELVGTEASDQSLIHQLRQHSARKD
jgi:hypothetical protein